MKITRISAYRVELPMREGSYSWAGHSFAAFDSTVVKVETDAGIDGFGEVCPLGPAYLAAYAEGARAAIAKLAPALIGEDPRHIERVYHRMDRNLKGHVDNGGIRKGAVALQAGETLTAATNTGWLLHDARRVARAVRDVDLYLEQPCLSYDECVSLRRHTDHPVILDECMDSLEMIMRGHRDRAMDVVNLKIMRMGGISRLRQARDLCARLGITMAIEDAWGGEIVTAAIAHLSQSAPPGFHFQSSAFTDYNTVHTADSGAVISGGFMSAGDAPGLGITPRMETLGEAVFQTVPESHSSTS